MADQIVTFESAANYYVTRRHYSINLAPGIGNGRRGTAICRPGGQPVEVYVAVALYAASVGTLWQDHDGATYEYGKNWIGLPVPDLDLTDQAEQAERDGLLVLRRIGVFRSRQWELTEAGRKKLAEVLAELDPKE